MLWYTDTKNPAMLFFVFGAALGALALFWLGVQARARADRIGDGFAAGLAVIDLAQLARAAAAGAVDTLIYDITTDIRGTLDETTGALQLADDGTDLLSRLAVQVLRGGGEVIAVRPGEVEAGIWNGRLLAGLRHPLA